MSHGIQPFIYSLKKKVQQTVCY